MNEGMVCLYYAYVTLNVINQELYRIAIKCMKPGLVPFASFFRLG
jgi:hypothetical protein